MREFNYTVKDKNGLHARPAGRLATAAKAFDSDVRVSLGTKEVDGKRLLSLMSLGAKCGSELHFVINGIDESEAEGALKAQCKEILGGE